MDANELKAKALLERIVQLSEFYEDRDANRRVEYTLLNEKCQRLEEMIIELTGENTDVSQESVAATD